MISRLYTNKDMLAEKPMRMHERLYNFSNVVKFSFIVQKSLSALDLELCKFCLQRGEKNTDTRSYFNPFPLIPQVAYVNTEESCRKYFWEDRKIMYEHNLDVPNCFEQSLRRNLPESSLESYGSYFNKLSISNTLDSCVLPNIKQYAFKNTDHKIKFIRMLVKLRKLKDPFMEHFWAKYGGKFLKDLRCKSNDSNLVKAVLKMIDFKAWMINNQEPELLEDLLFHVRRSKCNLKEGVKYKRDFINECIVEERFSDVEPFLNYKDCPHFTSESYRQLKKKMSCHIVGESMKKAEYHLGRKRSFLLLQVLWCYYNQNCPSVSEALHLIWESIPDACITLREIVLIFTGFLCPVTINNIFCYYNRTIGNSSDSTNIRSLKHFCKITMRRSLGSKKLWLPDAIKQIGLPTPLEAYLNLEAAKKK